MDPRCGVRAHGGSCSEPHFSSLEGSFLEVCPRRGTGLLWKDEGRGGWQLVKVLHGSTCLSLCTQITWGPCQNADSDSAGPS